WCFRIRNSRPGRRRGRPYCGSDGCLRHQQLQHTGVHMHRDVEALSGRQYFVVGVSVMTTPGNADLLAFQRAEGEVLFLPIELVPYESRQLLTLILGNDDDFELTIGGVGHRIEMQV